MNLLVISSIYPNSRDPNSGIFVRNRIVALSKYFNIKVISPVPWFPLLSWIRVYRGEKFRPIPLRNEIRDGIEVSYPRVFSVPLFLKPLDGLFFFFGIFFELLRFRKKFKPDIIHAHFVYPTGVAAAIASRLFMIPLFLSERGIIYYYPNYSFLIKWQIRFLLRNSNKIICLSNALKEEVLKIGHFSEKILVIPNGVDLQKFYIKDKAESRNRLRLPLEKKIILSVGNLTERKGYAFLINAVGFILGKEQNKDLLLYIIGGYFSDEPHTQRKFNKFIKEKQLADKIFLIGNVPNEELCDWYNAADIFCILSMAEGCPNVVLEALACGIPVVGNNIPGIVEQLSSKDAGIIVDAKEIKSVVEGFYNALGKTWDRQRIRKHVENRSWEDVARKEYEEIVKYFSQQKELKR